MSSTQLCIACEKLITISNFARHKRTKEHLNMYHEMLRKQAKEGKHII